MEYALTTVRVVWEKCWFKFNWAFILCAAVHFYGMFMLVLCIKFGKDWKSVVINAFQVNIGFKCVLNLMHPFLVEKIYCNTFFMQE